MENNKFTARIANLIAMFAQLFGASFISIKGYISSSTGEVADHTILVNYNVEHCKENDLKILQSVRSEQLKDIALINSLPINDVLSAHAELLASAIKNLNPDVSKRSAQSQGQTEAYVKLPNLNGVKFKVSEDNKLIMYVYGMAISKKVIQKGERKTVNSSNKTIAKNKIEKYFDLKMPKFRNFTVSSVEGVKMLGEEITING